MRTLSLTAASLTALALAATLAPPARASDASDVAREMKLPVAVVETTLARVDAFFAQAGGPANQMASGTVKEIALKAIRSRMGGLEDSVPGKASESSAEERNATYKAVVKTTRHDTTEIRECVDNRITLTGAEGVPAIKDGAFIIDTAHPRVSTASWDVTFCRSPNAGGGFSDWTPVAGK